MFKKGNEITLNRVQDTITYREGSEKLTLHVSGDSMRIVAGLNRAQTKLKSLGEESSEEEFKDAALYFAQVLFGKDQAESLFKFYGEDPGCVITACGKYFEERLGKLIAKQQKKLKR